MSRVIACVNEKGGVAKTTTVKNLAIGLAGKGKKVLVIDLDPSMNLTTSLGLFLQPTDPTILDILKAEMEGDDVPENYAIVHQNEGIDVICSTKGLHKFETELMYAMQREVTL